MVDAFAELEKATEELQAFCQRWKIRELALFGSVLDDSFSADSDLDFLVTFDGDAEWGLLEHVQMEQELAEILSHPVNLITRRAVERSANEIRRERILSTALPFFERQD